MFLYHPPPSLNSAQRSLIDLSFDQTVFLEGPSGAGKTTAAVERLLAMMAQGIPGNSILLLVPQRTLAGPYYAALNYPGVQAGGVVTILTPGGLAQRMVDLFWPVVVSELNFGRPDQAPVFLTLETAQYYMARLLTPLLAEGLFDSVTIDRNRLFSQVIDNLNKAALVGFGIDEIGPRLKEAWIGEPGQLHIYDDVQKCANLFRQYCLEHNLLDFSLQVEIFRNYLWLAEICQTYLKTTYRHILYDNLEEDTPFAHDLIRSWLPDLDSALLIYDWHAGYRRFLGADPVSASSLKGAVAEPVIFPDNLVMSFPVLKLATRLEHFLTLSAPGSPEPERKLVLEPEDGSARGGHRLDRQWIEDVLVFEQHRFYPQMLDWIADEVSGLVHNQGISPSEIVVLTPYLSDALRFSLMNRLELRQVPVRSHRPSRSLREEPVTLCLLTLASLAYPEWGLRPDRFEVAYALMQAIEGLDLVRAQILTEIVYRSRSDQAQLASFVDIIPDAQTRITFRLGERYERLRSWLGVRREPPDEFDHFISRLFGELLSQPGFGFHSNIQAGEVAANLVESIQKFRWEVGETLVVEDIPLGFEYLRMVENGVIAAQYVRSWQPQPEDAVLVAPAFTFLMSNRAVQVQFWLDAGSRGWSERLNQPLTHPYVLSRNWSRGRPWTDFDEVETSKELLSTMTLGLLQRCRQRVYLGISELGEQGFESRGPLLQALQRVLLSVDRQAGEG